MILLALAVFVISLAFDWVATRELQAVLARQPELAAAMAALLEGFSWLYVVAFISNKWLVIPAVVGAYLGTYLATKYHKSESSPYETP